VMWRGMGRTGRINWQSPGESTEQALSSNAQTPDASFYDWMMTVLVPGAAGDKATVESGSFEHRAAYVRVTWRPASMKPEELESLRRLIALRTDTTLLAEFGETMRAAERTHTALAERIWTRLYMDDGMFLAEGSARTFTNEARAGRTLSEVLSRMLHPLFGARYSQHPVFTQVLTESEVARL